MVNWKQIEREEADLERQLADGEITQDEFRRAMRDLQDDIRGAAEEAAERAYRDEMGGW